MSNLFTTLLHISLRYLSSIDVNFSHKEGESVSCVMKRPISIHKRISMGSSDTIDSAIDRCDVGCFNPQLNMTTKEQGRAAVDQFRHWIIIAKAGENTVDGRTVIQIVALPCVAVGSLSPLCENDTVDTKPSFYLESFVALPSGCTVSGIKFYGDDGSSSLSAGIGIAETVVEGRQSLGILVERVKAGGSDGLGGGQVTEELILLSYEDRPYRYVSVVDAGEEKIIIPELSVVDESNASCCVPLDDGQDESERAWPFKRRIIKVYPKLWSDTRTSSGYQASRFELSGSRGVGGVFSDAASSMDLFDFEEDEEEEEEEESFDV